MRVGDSGARVNHLTEYFRDEPLWSSGLVLLLMGAGARSIIQAILETWRTRAVGSFAFDALLASGLVLVVAAKLRADARKRAASPTQPAA